MDVAEPDVVQRVELLINPWLILEECERVFYREIENVGNAESAEANLESFPIVSLSLAHVARHVHVGKKVHLDLDQAIAFARFAATAFHVERESARSVTADLRFGHLGEQLADGSEEIGVGRRIRSRSSADRALVDIDDLVEMLESRDAIVLARNYARPVEMPGEGAMKNVFDKGGLS